MRHRTCIALFLLLAWSAMSGTATGQASFSYALIQNSCAPWDGPAIAVTLTREPAQCKRTSEPYIEIGVWRGLPVHAGQSVQFGSISDVGFASRCTKAGECERAQSGTIVFETYRDGSGASGHYELHFKGGETLKGTFDAKWCENHIMCG